MKHRRFPLVLSFLALSLSSFNMGLIAAKYYYQPQIADLEQKVEVLEKQDTTGKITAKLELDGRYTVVVSGYGRFLVSKDQYDSLEIGDEMPDFLKGRGS